MAKKNKPIQISGAAHKDLAEYVRKWSGHKDAALVFGKTHADISAWAHTEMNTKEVTVDPTDMILNPNRVLNTITPFRLRQEAVLTGVLLHEAAHLRFTRWGLGAKHADGSEPTPAVLALAHLMEEARIERRVAEANVAPGLEWTPRVAVSHLAPMTDLPNDPNEQIMAIIQSWTIRAARVQTVCAALGQKVPLWAIRFTTLLEDSLYRFFADKGSTTPSVDADFVLIALRRMAGMDPVFPAISMDEGSEMLTLAAEVIDRLFPETENPPMVQTPCSASASAAGEDDGEDGAESEDGEGESEDGEGESEDGEDGDEDGEGEDGSGDEQSEAQSEETKAMARLLAGVEQAAEDDAMETPSKGAGESSEPTNLGQGWRTPSADERGIQKGAEQFLRDMLDPSEVTVQSLTESPSSMVDAAALSAWKAGGQHSDPMFFVRRRREVRPQPPAKIAVLVDISQSMDVMQHPSALLSWALAEASINMANFAGRGQVIQSCLIHWGNTVSVVQKPGELLKGIRVRPCNEGTSNMHGALSEVENQMPGFFDAPPAEHPENRLLIQFTDWELTGGSQPDVAPWVHRAMSAGVKMLSVMPPTFWGKQMGDLPAIMRYAPGPGRSTHMIFDKAHPEQVWDAARKALSQ